MYVCLSAHAILAVRVIKSITNDTIVLRQICGNIKMAFFLKLYLIRKLEQGRPSLVDAMFRILSVTCLLTRKAFRLIIISD